MHTGQCSRKQRGWSLENADCQRQMFELSAKEESQHLHSMCGIMARVGIDCKALKAKWFMLARRKGEQSKIEFNRKSWKVIGGTGEMKP